jgi:hypothetical protein
VKEKNRPPINSPTGRRTECVWCWAVDDRVHIDAASPASDAHQSCKHAKLQLLPPHLQLDMPPRQENPKYTQTRLSNCTASQIQCNLQQIQVALQNRFNVPPGHAAGQRNTLNTTPLQEVTNTWRNPAPTNDNFTATQRPSRRTYVHAAPTTSFDHHVECQNPLPTTHKPSAVHAAGTINSAATKPAAQKQAAAKPRRKVTRAASNVEQPATNGKPQCALSEAYEGNDPLTFTISPAATVKCLHCPTFGYSKL